MFPLPWSLGLKYTGTGASRLFGTARSRMAPKKPTDAPKPLLGRPSNNLKMGVVGLPNVG